MVPDWSRTVHRCSDFMECLLISHHSTPNLQHKKENNITNVTKSNLSMNSSSIYACRFHSNVKTGTQRKSISDNFKHYIEKQIAKAS